MMAELGQTQINGVTVALHTQYLDSSRTHQRLAIPVAVICVGKAGLILSGWEFLAANKRPHPLRKYGAVFIKKASGRNAVTRCYLSSTLPDKFGAAPVRLNAGTINTLATLASFVPR